MKFPRPFLAISTIAAAALLVGCSGGDDAATATPTETTTATAQATATAPAETIAGIDEAALASVTLTTDLVPAGEVTLKDGAFEVEAAPGSASKIQFSLAETAFGDLDGDGADDAAVIVVSDGGGSGTFYDLHIILATADGPRDLGASPIGDRIVITGVAIDGNEVVVDYLDRAPDAPMSATPDVPTTIRVNVAADGSIAVQ